MQFVVGHGHAVGTAGAGQADQVLGADVRGEDRGADDEPAQVAPGQEVVVGRVFGSGGSPTRPARTGPRSRRRSRSSRASAWVVSPHRLLTARDPASAASGSALILLAGADGPQRTRPISLLRLARQAPAVAPTTSHRASRPHSARRAGKPGASQPPAASGRSRRRASPRAQERGLQIHAVAHPVQGASPPGPRSAPGRRQARRARPVIRGELVAPLPLPGRRGLDLEEPFEPLRGLVARLARSGAARCTAYSPCSSAIDRRTSKTPHRNGPIPRPRRIGWDRRIRLSLICEWPLRMTSTVTPVRAISINRQRVALQVGEDAHSGAGKPLANFRQDRGVHEAGREIGPVAPVDVDAVAVAIEEHAP